MCKRIAPMNKDPCMRGDEIFAQWLKGLPQRAVRYRQACEGGTRVVVCQFADDKESERSCGGGGHGGASRSKCGGVSRLNKIKLKSGRGVAHEQRSPSARAAAVQGFDTDGKFEISCVRPPL